MLNSESADAIGSVISAGYCSPNTAREYIKSGAMPFSVLWNPSDLGLLTVWVGKHLADGGAVDGPLDVPGLPAPAEYLPESGIILLGAPTVFTPDNVDDFAF